VAQAPTDVRDVILRDGSTLRLRRPRAADEDALLAFFSRLSDRSLYYRFHGLPAVGPRLVAPFLDPDGVERDALAQVMLRAVCPETRRAPKPKARLQFANKPAFGR